MPAKTPVGLALDIVRANFNRSALPYKVTLVATYRCNFRCEMCNIWQKDIKDEMTPAELESFFGRWSQFSWVHLTGGELFVRRDIEDIVAAIMASDRSLYLLNFPTTGWFGDRTVALVEHILRRGVGRLMTTISLDGPRALHDEMRGLPGSWDRAVETFRRLRGIHRSNYQVMLGMTLFQKNASKIAATIEAVRTRVPDFQRSDLHLNIGHESSHYFANAGFLGASPSNPVADAIEAHRKASAHRLNPVNFLENRYQALVKDYYGTHKSPLPCTAMASSCFIDAHWEVFPCSIWGKSLGNLREYGFDFRELWTRAIGQGLRKAVVDEQCPHCWTPCEAYPTILGNLSKLVTGMTHAPVGSEPCTPPPPTAGL
jgi:MoaA/NifB/PqqE/SkfB family radical SAM enzyme